MWCSTRGRGAAIVAQDVVNARDNAPCYGRYLGVRDPSRNKKTFGESAMQTKNLVSAHNRTLACSLVILALLVATPLVSADPSIAGGWVSQDNQGPYAIGHTTLVLTDNSRNPDGSAPVTTAGRPLYLHIWYPTSAGSGQHIRYTWNNPVYNQNPGGSVYPGLPDTPSLSFTGSTSAHAIAEDVPLANGRFPFLVATHGYEGAATKNMPDTLETLASHGYIVASVEHTGDDDAWYQTYFMEQDVGLKLGPNPSIYAATILQRVKDVSFVIGAVLDGKADRSGAPFAKRINANEIGVIGYSLGGQTSLATVTGISSQSLPADRRVKAAFMGAGSNYGLLMNATDYANAKVPLMFFGNDTGIAYSNFNGFTGSPRKYLVDIAGWNHHVGGYQTSWCQDIHNSLVAINPAVFPQAFINPATLNPSDIANFVFDSTFYWTYTGPYELGVYNYCDGSVFDGVSDAQLQAVLFGNPQILTAKSELQDAMPLERELPITEMVRLTDDYAVAFFDVTLKHDGYAMPDEENPLVHVIKQCEHVRAHPFDLAPGDQIAFVPTNESYSVTVRSGVSLLDAGTTKLSVAGNGTATLSYPGFSFSVPGTPDPVTQLFVSEDGAITTRTSGDYTGVDDSGSPWYMRGQLLLTNRLTIGSLMKDLDSTAATAGGGVFAYYDAASQRVIVTYQNVPAAGTSTPNTLQIVIYSSGKIDITVGELANTGPNYAPGILGTIGIASGQTKATAFRSVKPIDFAALRDRPPVVLPFAHGGAIYEQYYQGVDRSCDHDND
jgi:dienelactone hydrolase